MQLEGQFTRAQGEHGPVLFYKQTQNGGARAVISLSLARALEGDLERGVMCDPFPRA